MVNPFGCSRCLLSTDVPDVQVGSDGICSVCHQYDTQWGKWNEIKDERRKALDNILNKARSKKRHYDVLVPLSGGKDSTYILYLCRTQFNLKCLSVTFDNGFLSDHARQNIVNACDKLGADHMFFRFNKDLLMRLYRHFFLKTGFFCPACMQGMNVAVSRAQQAYKIPLTISGTSRRTEEHVSPAFFIDNNINFIENVLENEALKNEVGILLEPAGIFSSPPGIRLPDYMDWNYDEIYKTIKTELGWKAHTKDAEHTDCKVDDIVNYIRYIKYPALVPEMLRFSKLVTIGQMSREEAKQRVAANKETIHEPENLQWFFDTFKISRDEFDQVIAEPLLYVKYMEQRNRIWRRLKYLRSKLLP